MPTAIRDQWFQLSWMCDCLQLTHWRSDEKALLEAGHKEGGQRKASQVLGVRTHVLTEARCMLTKPDAR